MNISIDILEKWNNLLEIIRCEVVYEAGFNEGYTLAIDEGSSTAYNDGYKDAKEEYEC